MYARYSSDNQRDESVEAQIRAMTKYCQDNEIAIVGEYIDKAKSATTDDRPEFQRMIADSKQAIFNIVLVHKIDRFARNRRDSLNYRSILKCKSNGGRPPFGKNLIHEMLKNEKYRGVYV